MGGTTIMGCIFDGGVVLGCDTRVSTGQYVANRASRKISCITEKIWLCRSGSAADTQALMGIVKNYLGQHEIELGDDPAVATAAWTSRARTSIPSRSAGPGEGQGLCLRL